jgi:hypothetical protein
VGGGSERIDVRVDRVDGESAELPFAFAFAFALPERLLVLQAPHATLLAIS